MAQRLGHTPAVCRKSHVHPEILNACLAGERLDPRSHSDIAEGLEVLKREEQAAPAFLRGHLQTDTG